MSGHTQQASVRRSGLGMSVAAGVLAAVGGAIAWAVVTEVTHRYFGLVAVGIGLLVGWAMASQAGTSRALPVIGAVMALVGCLLGDLLIDAVEVSRVVGASLSDVLTRMLQEPSWTWQVYRIGFGGLVVVFYAIAAFEGFKITSLAVQRRRALSAAAAAAAAAAALASGSTPSPATAAPDPQAD